MSASRDPDRLIHAYLMEGTEHLQDRVYDAVRADIETRRQRGRFGPWRMPNMNKLVPIGVGAAAVVVALVAYTQFLGPSGPGGPGATGSAKPSATPAASVPSTPSPTRRPAGLLDEGPHVLLTDGVPITVTIPAPDWYGDPADGILTKDDNSATPDGAGIIVFAGEDLYVYGDPCQWSTSRPETPATTVDEVVAALAAQASRDASAPVDVTVDGYAGKSMTLHVPEDAVFSECDQGFFASWGVPGDDPSRYHQDPGQIDKLWIVDVDDKLVVFDTAYYEGTPQAVVDEMDAIVESAKFE